MNGKTFLAFDFGEKRIGVAVGNDVTESATALTTIEALNDAARFKAIETLINEWRPHALIVGHPKHPDGTPHEMTLRAEKFARQLEGRFRCKSILVDERYSSVEAELLLAAQRGGRVKSKLAIDAEAAAMILRRFFETQMHREVFTSEKASSTT